VPYFLVLLQPVANAGAPPEHQPYVDSLVARNLVFLGGPFEPRVGGADAAYLVYCDTLRDAQGIAAEDPLVTSGSMRAKVVEWQLVGINPDAIEPTLELRPSDIPP
jgi:uncharacterized protein YciI